MYNFVTDSHPDVAIKFYSDNINERTRNDMIERSKEEAAPNSPVCNKKLDRTECQQITS